MCLLNSRSLKAAIDLTFYLSNLVRRDEWNPCSYPQTPDSWRFTRSFRRDGFQGMAAGEGEGGVLGPEKPGKTEKQRTEGGDGEHGDHPHRGDTIVELDTGKQHPRRSLTDGDENGSGKQPPREAEDRGEGNGGNDLLMTGGVETQKSRREDGKDDNPVGPE